MYIKRRGAKKDDKQDSALKDQIITQGKNNTKENVIIYRKKIKVKVLIFSRSFNGMVKAFSVFLRSNGLVFEIVTLVVSTVVIHWLSDVLGSYDRISSEATQLLGLSDLYKHMSQRLAWMKK